MAGIKETKELLDFAIALCNGVGRAAEDGDYDFTDLVDFVPVVRTLGDAFQGVTEVPRELADLSEVEYQELLDYVREEFDIPQDRAELYLEKAFEAGLRVAEMVCLFFVEPEEAA